MKKSLCLVLLAAVSCVGAAPLVCTFDKWDVNPLAWSCDAAAGTLVAGPLGSKAVYNPAERSACLHVAARVTPTSAGTNGWAVLGVAFVDDDRNYWHVAFVKGPPEQGAHHYFELCEMRDGRWIAQTEDRLVVTRNRTAGTWAFGTAYDVSLDVDAAGIVGTVKDAKSGKVVFERGYAWPRPEADGSIRAVTAGRPALNANGGFCGTFTALDATWSEPRPAAAANAIVPYVSDSFVPDITDKATGFFRVVKRDDGRWWTIDPLGRGVVLLGIDHVTYWGHGSERTKRQLHLEHNKVEFPNKKDWEASALKRLKAWGFNMLGAGCDPALQRQGLIHTIFLSIGDGLCWNGLPAEYFICPNERRPCSAFPNVFHPQFAAWADYVARQKCAPNRNDPWLFGYFIDNELAWWGRGAEDTGLFDAVARLPDTHSAKIAQKKFLAERGLAADAVSAAVKLDFLRLAADIYFRVSSEAIRRHDPNHLVMGARFAGIGGAHPAVWEVSGKYCDVVTFNCYPWADLDRNVMMTERGGTATRIVDAFAKQYGYVNRPMLITEWSFPALDSGLPCTGGAGQRFRTQTLRTRATELFAKTMLSLPFLLGYDYFMWVDQPAAGMSDAFPEDSNYGLITEQGIAYPEITTMFTKLHKHAGTWRQSPPPAERTDVPPATGVTAAAFQASLAPANAAQPCTIERTDGRYVVRNAAGLELAGRLGGRYMFDTIKLAGRTLGSYTGMLNDQNAAGGFRWHDARNVTAMDARVENGAAVLTVTSEGGVAPDALFRLTHRITVFPDKPWFLCDLVSVQNVGTKPIDVRAIYFRQYSPFAFDKQSSAHKAVPNLWKAPLRDAWVRTSDGTYFGGLTQAATGTMFAYQLMNDGKSQHPDAMFTPETPLVLAPGAVYEPKGTMWMLALCGLDGYAGFKAVTEKWAQ